MTTQFKWLDVSNMETQDLIALRDQLDQAIVRRTYDNPKYDQNHQAVIKRETLNTLNEGLYRLRMLAAGDEWFDGFCTYKEDFAELEKWMKRHMSYEELLERFPNRD